MIASMDRKRPSARPTHVFVLSRNPSSPTPLALLITLLLAACGSSCRAIPAYTYRNTASDILAPQVGASWWTATPSVPRASIQFPDAVAAPRVFVGVGVSGGGSRAANFAGAVLQQLDEVGFLRSLSAISSVSGGSLTSAYYALNRHKSEWSWPELRRLLRTDFFSKWAIRLLYPQSLLPSLLTDYTASDTMAKVFDDVLFHGATYEDLGPVGPLLFVNATDASDMSFFSFSAEKFLGELGSDLGSYPIADSVMASGAFPGVFPSVTLRRFRQMGTIKNDRLVGRFHDPSPRYAHLFDGGASDNLGIRSLRVAAQNAYIASERRNAPLEGCFIFLIDAYQNPGTNEAVREASTRSLADRLIDRNALSAFDMLMTLRRETILREIGDPGRHYGSSGHSGDKSERRLRRLPPTPSTNPELPTGHLVTLVHPGLYRACRK